MEHALLVTNVVLGASNGTSTLDTSNSVGQGDTLEVRVGTETLRVTASGGEAAQRTTGRAENDIDTLVAGFRAQAVTTVSPEVTTESTTDGEGGGESAVVIVQAQTERTILHTQALQSQAGNATNVTDALLAHPTAQHVLALDTLRNSMVLFRKVGDIPNTSGDVDLFSESELRNEGLGLGVGIGPSRSGRVHPW